MPVAFLAATSRRHPRSLSLAGRLATLATLLGFCLVPALARGDETVSVCYNWSCKAEAPATFSDALLAQVEKLLQGATDATSERHRIARALGRLYAEAARQTPISGDRPGNWADADNVGRMDCIDHSITTTRLLHLFEAHGWLRWHRAGERAWRAPHILDPHYTAVIEELPRPPAAAQGAAEEAEKGGGKSEDGTEEEDPPRYAVDSWYVLPGEAPLVMPLDNWLKGEGPDVD